MKWCISGSIQVEKVEVASMETSHPVWGRSTGPKSKYFMSGRFSFNSVWPAGLIIIVLLLSNLAGLSVIVGADSKTMLIDSDYDSLSDEYEMALGTDPFDPDTDSDGILDAEDPEPLVTFMKSSNEETFSRLKLSLTPKLTCTNNEVEIQVTVPEELIPATDDASDNRNITVYILKGETRMYKLHAVQLELQGTNSSLYTATGSFLPELADKYHFITGFNLTDIINSYWIYEHDLVNYAEANDTAYGKITVYPEFFSTVESKYDYLLRGHSEELSLARYCFSQEKVNTLSDLQSFKEQINPKKYLEDLYQPVNGSVYLYVSGLWDYLKLNVNSTNTSFEFVIPDNSYNYIDCKVYANYNDRYGYNVFFDSVRITIVDDVVQWMEYPDLIELYDTATITLCKYTLKNTISEDIFNSEYGKLGAIGLIKNYPEYAESYKGTAWICIFYNVYNYYAYEIVKTELAVTGTGEASWMFDVPGAYFIAGVFEAQRPNNPTGKFRFNSYYRGQTRISGTCIVNTDADINIHADKNLIFTGDAVDIAFSFTAEYNLVKTIPICISHNSNQVSPSTYVDPLKGYTELEFKDLSFGTHEFIAYPVFSERTRSVVNIFGKDYLHTSWLAEYSIDVVNLAILADMPAYFTQGREVGMRVIVLEKGMHPSTGTEVTVEMARNPNTAPEFVFRDSVDGSGSVKVKIKVPFNYTNYLVIKATATSGLVQELARYINYRPESIQGMIESDKTKYKPGETMHLRFTVWNADASKPYLEPLKLKISDPNGNTLIREEVVPNEYGICGYSLPLSDEATEGEYEISLQRTDNSVIALKRISVEQYEVPDVHLYFRSELEHVKQGENITVPVQVEYKFGTPVVSGKVNYNLTGFIYHGYDWNYYYYEGAGDGRNWGTGSFSGYGSGSGAGAGCPDYGGWYEEKPFGQFIVDVADQGWANLSFRVPVGIDRLSIEAEFNDEYDHFAEGIFCFDVGDEIAQPGDIDFAIETEKDAYNPFENVEVSVHVWIPQDKELAGGEGHVAPSSFKAVIHFGVIAVTKDGNYKSVYDENIHTSYIYPFKWTGILDQGTFMLTEPLDELLAEGYLTYIFNAQLVCPDIKGVVAVQKTIRFHQYHFSLRTDGTDYEPGDEVTIIIKAKELISDEPAQLTFSLEISSKTNPQDLFLVRNGIIFTTSSQKIIWKIPAKLEAGLYTITATFRTDDFPYVFTMKHDIQVRTNLPLKMVITGTPESYEPAQKIPINIKFYGKYSGWVYWDIIAGDTMISKEILVQNINILGFNFIPEFQNVPLTLKVYIIDGYGRVIEDDVMILARQVDASVVITTNRTDYKPGDRASLTIEVMDDSGELIKNIFVTLSIVDIEELLVPPQDYSGDFFKYFKETERFDRAYSLTPNWDFNVYYWTLLHSYTELFWPDYFFTPNCWYDDDNDDYKSDGAGTGGSGSGSGPGSGSGSGSGSNGIGYAKGPPSNEGSEDWEGPGKTTVMPETAALDSLTTELAKSKLRRWFTSTCYWTTGIFTSTGHLTLNITLPDNLAKWQVTAAAVTTNCKGIVSTAEFNTTKDFFVEPVIPRTATQDDEIEFKVRVYNLGEESTEVTVGLEGESWLEVFGKSERTLKVDARTIKELTYPVRLTSCGVQTLTVVASDFSEHRDAVEDIITVRPNGALKITHLKGKLMEQEVILNFTIYEELIDNSLSAVLKLSPGYKGLMLETIKSLGGYPYGCNEQTMSLWLPDILIWDYLKSTENLDPATKDKLDDWIQVGIQKFYDRHHADGGWGWYKDDQSNVWMTAYILLGLSRAVEAGIYIDPEAIEDGQNYLIKARLDDGSWEDYKRWRSKPLALTAYTAFSLEYSGVDWPDIDTYNYLKSVYCNEKADQTFDAYSLAFYALALMQKEGSSDLIDSILKDLISMRVGYYWKGGSSMGGPDETTAWVLTALHKSGKVEYFSIIQSGITWLNSVKGHRYGWGGTSDTIAVLWLLAELISQSNENDMILRVYLNDVFIKEIYFKNSNDESYYELLENHIYIELTDIVKPGVNKIRIEKIGTGFIFYELIAEQHLRIDVDVTCPERITLHKDEVFEINMDIEPEYSEVVFIDNLQVIVPGVKDLTEISSKITKPQHPCGIYTYTGTFLYSSSSNFHLGPILVQYNLLADNSSSGVIREYLQPIIMTITPDYSLPLKTEYSYLDVQLQKSIDRNYIGMKESLNVYLVLSNDRAKDNMITVTVTDNVPDNFVFERQVAGPAGEMDGSSLTWTIKLGNDPVAFVYSLKPLGPGQALLPRATASTGNTVIAITGAIAVSIYQTDFHITRSYSTYEAFKNEPVKVTLDIETAPGNPIFYGAIEDYLGPGCQLDIKSVRDNLEHENIIIFEAAEDRLTFFMDRITSVQIEYYIIPTNLGEVVIPPAIVYPMYTPELIAQTLPDLLRIGIVEDEPEALAEPELAPSSVDISISPEDVIISPESPRPNSTFHVNVTVRNVGEKACSAVTIWIIIGDKSQSTVGEVEAGGTFTLLSRWVMAEGTYSAVVKADCASYIIDDNPDNNVLIIEFNVGTKKSDIDENENANVGAGTEKTGKSESGYHPDLTGKLNINRDYIKIGEEVAVDITVTSRHDLPLRNIELRVYYNDIVLIFQEEFDMFPEGTMRFTFTVEPNSPGIHKFTLIIDYQDIFIEESETNNIVIDYLIVKDSDAVLESDESSNIAVNLGSSLTALLMVGLTVLTIFIVTAKMGINPILNPGAQQKKSGNIKTDNNIKIKSRRQTK